MTVCRFFGRSNTGRLLRVRLRIRLRRKRIDTDRLANVFEPVRRQPLR